MRCGKEFRYPRNSDGRIDEGQYAIDHAGDMAQPRGPTADVFKHVHGEKKFKEAQKFEKQLQTKERKKKQRAEEIKHLKKKLKIDENKTIIRKTRTGTVDELTGKGAKDN